MAQSGAAFQADVRRLCSLGLPLPALSAALAPLLRASFGASYAAFSVLGEGGDFAYVSLSDVAPPADVVELISDAAAFARMDRASSVDSWAFLRSGLAIQNTAGLIGRLAREPLYARFFQPFGIHHWMRVPVHLAGRPSGFVVLGRPPGERPFGARDSQRFAAIAPWLSPALAATVGKAGADWNAEAETGTAILDAAGRVLYRCGEAERLLYMLAHPDGRTDAMGGRVLMRLLASLTRQGLASRSGSPARPTSWHGPTAWGAFFLRVAPLEGTGTGFSSPVALSLSRRVSLSMRVASALAGVRALSTRQKDICLGLAEGLSRADIAARLGIGQNTVVTHARDLYARLGVENREGMLRAVLEGSAVGRR